MNPIEFSWGMGRIKEKEVRGGGREGWRLERGIVGERVGKRNGGEGGRGGMR